MCAQLDRIQRFVILGGTTLASRYSCPFRNLALSFFFSFYIRRNLVSNFMFKYWTEVVFVRFSCVNIYPDTDNCIFYKGHTVLSVWIKSLYLMNDNKMFHSGMVCVCAEAILFFR